MVFSCNFGNKCPQSLFVLWKIVAVCKNVLKTPSSPTRFHQEIVLTLQCVPGLRSGLLPWAVSWHWIMHFFSCLHCFPKCIFINFLPPFIFSWSLQFFMWNTWKLFLKVSSWAGDQCLFRHIVIRERAAARVVQFPCSGRAGSLPGHPAACKCHWSCWKVAGGLPALLMAWKYPFFLCVHCLTLVTLNFKMRAWPGYKWYDIIHKQVGRNATIPGVTELTAFLSQMVQLKSWYS